MWTKAGKRFTAQSLSHHGSQEGASINGTGSGREEKWRMSHAHPIYQPYQPRKLAQSLWSHVLEECYVSLAYWTQQEWGIKCLIHEVQYTNYLSVKGHLQKWFQVLGKTYLVKESQKYNGYYLQENTDIAIISNIYERLWTLKLKELWLIQKWRSMHKAYQCTVSLQREKATYGIDLPNSNVSSVPQMKTPDMPNSSSCYAIFCLQLKMERFPLIKMDFKSDTVFTGSIGTSGQLLQEG